MRAVPPRTTRVARVPFSGWLALGSAGLALLAPTPYILEGPGPAVDLLGEREGRPVLRVEGGEADPGEGTLDMTTVMVGGPPIGTTSLLDLGRGLTDPAVDVVPRELMYPTGVTSDEVGEANSAAMSDSQQTATAAALHELGREVPQRLVVQQLVPGGPAEGVLRAGDEVIAAEGRPVADLEAVRAAVGAAGPDPVTLTVRRDGVEQDLEVPVAAAPEGAPQPWQMGALIETAYDVPVDVELTVPDIGGPSAGLMFALTVIERLTPGAMTGAPRSPERARSRGTASWVPSAGSRRRCAAPPRRGPRRSSPPRRTARSWPAVFPRVSRCTPWTRWARPATSSRRWPGGRPRPPPGRAAEPTHTRTTRPPDRTTWPGRSAPDRSRAPRTREGRGQSSELRTGRRRTVRRPAP